MTTIEINEPAVPRTMKAAFVTEFGKPLTIGELPVPQPADGQVLIKVEACGVCHTDVHAADGDGRSSRNSLLFPDMKESVG
jgi:propanol-preferring alcohol dehydrogenase